MVLIIVLLVLIVFFVIGFFLTKALFMPEKAIEWTEDEGEIVSFKSGSYTLEGRLINKEGNKGTIIFAHGMGLSSHYYRPEVLHFASMGYKVFIFEYRGYGKSNGLFLSFRDVVKDIVSASEYLNEKDIILVGHSMGGYGVLSSLDELKGKVKGVVAYAPFRSPFTAMDVCAMRMGIVGRIAEVFLFPFQYLINGYKANKSAIHGINNSSCPMLILQGNGDKEVAMDGCSVVKKRDTITNSLL
ncbi:MAG: alpha/beta hydrolase, partial [Candidatus Ornithospirochaeta sp.]